MRELPAVKEAKDLMSEAQDWSVWRWLLDKKRVRAAADRANEALDSLAAEVYESWAADLKRLYRECNRQKQTADAARANLQRGKNSHHGNSEIRLSVERVKQADADAYSARMDAEQTFREAERQLSASVAREGARKAIECWKLKEKAIRMAQALARRK